MNSSTFFNYFINNGTIDMIAKSLEQSEFTNTNNKLPIIVKTIMANYKYTTVNCQQNGLPNTKRNKNPRKISYCTNFDLMLNNFYSLIAYELCKYLLIKTSMKEFLTKNLNIIKAIPEDKQDLFTTMVTEWLDLCYSNTKKFNYAVIEEQIVNTKFYHKHKKTEPEEIKSALLEDLDIINPLVYNDVKKETIKVLSILIDAYEYKVITINMTEDLVVKMDHFDILYTGSFIKIITDLFDQRNRIAYEKALQEYELSSTIETYFKTNLNAWINQLVNRIQSIRVTSNYIGYLTEAIIYYFVVLGFNLAKSYNIILGFDKTSRIHFKTVFGCILQTVPLFSEYTPTQLTLIHYSLLTKEQLAKSIDIIQSDEKTDESAEVEQEEENTEAEE